MPIDNWDDLRLFAAIVRTGRMATAARELGIDHSTVSRRMTGLESSLGAQLLDRSPAGVRLTSAGTALLPFAERIEAEAHGAERSLGGLDQGVSGTVRLATPEAFGTYLVARQLHRLAARHPGLQLELVPASQSVSLTKREADLAVALSQPPKGRLYARRLTDYRLGLYASRDYLARHQPITSIKAISDHPFVWYIDELIDLPELRYLDQVVAGARTVFRSSSIAAQHEAVAAGVGLGVLHGFVAGTDSRFIPVLQDEVSVSRSYWLVLHADQRNLPRIRAVVDFLTEIVVDAREHLV